MATPRRAMLLPGRGQLVRLRVTAPPSADGAEYRSHLTITTVPPRNVGLTAEQAAAAQTSDRLSFQITSLFGISIPIIVRSSAPDVRAAVVNPHISYVDMASPGESSPKRTPVLTLTIQRTGANSLFGNLEVRSGRGRALLGLARGVGVYPEIDGRLLSVPLQRSPAPGETLDIAFVDDDANPGRVVARTAFVAP